MVIFLDPNLRIAKWIYGTEYSGSDIDAALRVAAGESDWIGRHSDVLYAVLLFLLRPFVALLFSITCCNWFSCDRANGPPAGDHASL